MIVDLSKLSDVVKLVLLKKDAYNSKIKNIEDRIPDIANLATTIIAVTAADNKISNAGNSKKQKKKKKEKKLTRTQKDQNILHQEYFKITYIKYFRA